MDKNGFKMVGEQYYKILNDTEADLIRVVRVINADKVKVLNGNSELVEMNVKDILDNYTLITPDGLLTITAATIGKDSNGLTNNDVIICVYRTIETDKGDYTPYIICRQNINDFFYNYISQSEEHFMVGVSVRKDNLPENIAIESVTACDGISDSLGINIYMEDTVDSILGLIKPNKMKVYNRILEDCYDRHTKAIPCNPTDVLLGRPVDGYCRTVEELLKVNNFQTDLDSAFNIISVDTVLSKDIIKVDDEFGPHYELPAWINNQLGKVFNKNIINTIVIQYSREIDIAEFSGNNIVLLRDNENLLYIVNYISAGEFREYDLEVLSARTALDDIKDIFSGKMHNKY